MMVWYRLCSRYAPVSACCERPVFWSVMTEQELRQLIAGGETLSVEFKSDSPGQKSGLSDEELQDAVVCLANAEGGALLLGVEDGGTITGLHAKHQGRPANGISAYLRNVLQGSSRPEVQAEIVITSDGAVAVIQVSKASSLVSTSQGRMLKRRFDSWGNPECATIYPHEIPALLAVKRQYDHTQQPIRDLGFDALSLAEFDRIRGFVRRQPQADKALLELDNAALADALGLVQREGKEIYPTVAGILVAGDIAAIRAYIPGHEVGFQQLEADQDVTANDFYREPLLRVWELYENFFLNRNPQKELRFGLERMAVPQYPERAVREAFANALVHRDYTLLNAVYFQFKGDQLNITSPGAFMDGITVQNLLYAQPTPRNPLLADIFKRLGLVERTGRGVPRIFGDVLSSGRPAPKYKSDGNSVSVAIPGGEADVRFVEMVIRAQDEHQTMDWRHLMVMHHLSKARELSAQEAAPLANVEEAQCRNILEELLDWGLVERRRSGRNATYHLSSAVYQELNQLDEYERRKQAETDADEQWVINRIKERGRVKRSEVIQENRMEKGRAEYLLQRLRNEKKIVLIGRGQAAHYILPETNSG